MLRKVRVPASVKHFAVHPEPYQKSISSALRLAAAIEANGGHCCVIVDHDEATERALSPLERYWRGRLSDEGAHGVRGAR
jgi:hypothetical protein